MAKTLNTENVFYDGQSLLGGFIKSSLQVKQCARLVGIKDMYEIKQSFPVEAHPLTELLLINTSPLV